MIVREYKCVDTNNLGETDYLMIPIRDEDKFEIMNWRNDQIDFLRQSTLLDEKTQNGYFKEVITPLFSQDKPSQILFSFLKSSSLIGYGGLVHINWIDRNAEISFLTKGGLESELFSEYWSKYLSILKKIAFDRLKLHKIYTYAFDLRPNLYEILEKQGFTEDARLKEHCLFNGKFIDVVIHSKISTAC